MSNVLLKYEQASYQANHQGTLMLIPGGILVVKGAKDYWGK